MFSLLVGLGVLLLAVFVSAMLDPRPSRSGTAAERAHSDDGCDHLIDGTLGPGVRSAPPSRASPRCLPIVQRRRRI